MPVLEFHIGARAVLDALRSFVRAEFDAQRHKFHERLELSLAERVDQGTCLAGLRFVRIDEGRCALFQHDGNDSRLREGDAVRLRQGDVKDGIRAWIYREEGDRIWLASEGQFKTATFEAGSSGWLIDEDFVDLERHYLEALDRLPACEIGQERILPLLLGIARTALHENEYNAALEELNAQAIQWEDAQCEAIAGCLAADHCYLVQGPPGTGKTRVLAQVVRQLVERGERVLITAFTHRAIDNALAATAPEVGDRQRVARFGMLTHRRDENYDLYEFFADSPLAAQSGGWVAAATPFALRKRLPAIEFDTIVIDEAGQMTTPLAIMVMLSGRKYFLFGDQQQLGPVVVSRSRREVESVGVFHALRYQAIQGTRLDVTFRLNDILAKWPSEHFYEGALQPSLGAADRRLMWHPTAGTDEWVGAALDPDAPLVWMAFDHSNCRTWCEEEVCAAARLLQALCAAGIKPEEMAVVTPYRRQARRLRKRVETLCAGTSWRGCVIDTVERMQGQEREVVIISLCASDATFVRWQADFLYDPRRLNVAATRARSKLIVMASDALLHPGVSDTDLQEDVELLRSLKKASRCVSPPPS